MTCPRCGAAYLPADPECPHCGLPFPTATAATSVIHQGPSRTTRDSERPWIIRGASVVGVLLAAFLVLHFIGPGDDGTVSTWRPADLPDIGPSASASAANLPSLDADGIPTAENLAASGSVKADRTAAPGTDGAGQKVTYGAENLIDHDPRTAWRVAGFGTGEAITITLAATSRIQVVGLTNGYTKVDATSGKDWYPDGRRILSVTWIFDNGTNVNQDLQDDDRSVQLLRIPAIDAQSVRLQINTTTTPGDFTDDYTSISEVFLGKG